MTDSEALSVYVNTARSGPFFDVADLQEFKRIYGKTQNGSLVARGASPVGYFSNRTDDYGVDDRAASGGEEKPDQTAALGPPVLPDTPRSNQTDDVSADDSSDTPRSNITNDLSGDNGLLTAEFFDSDDECPERTPLEEEHTDM